MFESLNDAKTASTPRERWLRYAAVVVVCVALFGGLYAFVHFYE